LPSLAMVSVSCMPLTWIEVIRVTGCIGSFCCGSSRLVKLMSRQLPAFTRSTSCNHRSKTTTEFWLGIRGGCTVLAPFADVRDNALTESRTKGERMSITVKNTTPDAARITLVGELQDGSFKAKVMTETDVPYTPYWEHQVEQRMVYIQPDPEQLKAIVTALNERRLTLDQLQSFGSAGGGTSEIPV
jgi:hypothetical protein